MPDLPLHAAEIAQYLAEVADELADTATQRTVIIVGGAMLALRGLRDATRDVDSVSRLDDDLAAAIARVAERHGLAPRWLNDSALPFLPATLREDHCDVLIDRTALRVLGASFDDVFIMKLYASRAADTDDMEALWPSCSFESPEAAAEAFHAAYPHLKPDLFLADQIARIV